jgi:hypothetical protein
MAAVQFRHRGKLYVVASAPGKPTAVGELRQHLRRRPIRLGLWTLWLWWAAWRALRNPKALPPG